MAEPNHRRPSLYTSRLSLKIAAVTLLLVAVVAGLGLFWEYRKDQRATEGVLFHEMGREAEAIASLIETTGDLPDPPALAARMSAPSSPVGCSGSCHLRQAGPRAIFIVDAHGLVLASSRPEIIGRPLVEALGQGPMGLPAVLSGREVTTSAATGTANGKVVHVSVPLRRDRRDPARVTGAVHLMAPYAYRTEALWWGIGRWAAIGLGLALLFAAALTLTLAGVVVAPLRRLADAMRRAEEGSEVTVPVTSRDEVGDLTRSFNQMVAELRRRRDTLQALYAIDRAASQSLELEAVLRRTLETLCEAMAVQTAGFYLLEPDGETLTLRAHRGIAPDSATALARIRRGEGVSGQAMALGQPVATDLADYPAPRLAPILEAEGIRSLAAALVVARGRILGTIVVGSHRARPFTQEELNLLGSIGQQVGPSVENAQLYQRVEQARTEWQSSFDSLPDLVAIINRDHRLVRVNRAMAERLRASPEQLIGQRCYAAVHGTDSPRPGCPYVQTLVTGQPASLEADEPQLGGTFQITTAPLRNAGGQLRGCIHIARDITEVRRLEEEARQRQRFEDLSRAKSAFIATMSHELRTPLNSVIGFSELMLGQAVGPLTEKQARYLGHIHQAGKHLLDLINDILDVSRVEAGKIELVREALALDEAVEATLALARPQAAKAGVVLRTEVPANLPPVLADPVRLKQILFNLVSNAIKFTPAGGTVTVTARRGDGSTSQRGDSSRPIDRLTARPLDHGDFTEIAVRDTGIGIKPEDIPKLFKEFGQLEAGKAPEKRGTGLGLALTKKLVELHGGWIWVQSEGEGRGSTFAFTLPLAGAGGHEA